MNVPERSRRMGILGKLFLGLVAAGGMVALTGPNPAFALGQVLGLAVVSWLLAQPVLMLVRFLRSQK
jgi:hypothetical protein